MCIHQTRSYRREVAAFQRGGRGSGDALGYALNHPVSLIVCKEENLVALNGAAERAAKLVLVIGAALSLVEEVRGIEIGIAHEFEKISVVAVGAGLGYHVDQAAAVIAVLGVGIVCQDAKLINRIEVGNRAGAGKSELLHQHSIQDETVF